MHPRNLIYQSSNGEFSVVLLRQWLSKRSKIPITIVPKENVALENSGGVPFVMKIVMGTIIILFLFCGYFLYKSWGWLSIFFMAAVV